MFVCMLHLDSIYAYSSHVVAFIHNNQVSHSVDIIGVYLWEFVYPCFANLCSILSSLGVTILLFPLPFLIYQSTLKIPMLFVPWRLNTIFS